MGGSEGWQGKVIKRGPDKVRVDKVSRQSYTEDSTRATYCQTCSFETEEKAKPVSHKGSYIVLRRQPSI